MARGLSTLQQTILRLAHLNGMRGATGSADVYQHQVLAEHFGWEPDRGIGSRRYFSPRRIGPAAYNAGRASLSRAITRLEQRQLVRRVRHGIVLTDRGWEVAFGPETAAQRGTQEGAEMARIHGLSDVHDQRR